MPYQSIYRYALLPDQAYSAYSCPRQDHEDGSYEIHLIKSGNPTYIPADFEVWPIYYNAMMKVLFEHPDVHAPAVDAAKMTAEKLKGLENRDIPPAPSDGPVQPPSHHFSTLLLSPPAANDSKWVL